jgi:hypothetical protein
VQAHRRHGAGARHPTSRRVGVAALGPVEGGRRGLASGAVSRRLFRRVGVVVLLGASVQALRRFMRQQQSTSEPVPHRPGSSAESKPATSSVAREPGAATASTASATTATEARADATAKAPAPKATTSKAPAKAPAKKAADKAPAKKAAARKAARKASPSASAKKAAPKKAPAKKAARKAPPRAAGPGSDGDSGATG